MACPNNFNPVSPLVMHIDLNSCFASVEQQANPLLRGKPVVVAAHAQPFGCILAPSVEAKLYGIKTGMSIAEGLVLCPFLIVREADPPKYREIHAKFGQLLSEYSPHLISKSIDEFCLILPTRSHLEGLSREIKSRVKSEIGDWLRVSIGVSTNQILAKLASGLHKPDGFDIINASNFTNTYTQIKLQDFCGINVRNEARLHRVGIFTPLQFYHASLQSLHSAFGSVLGRYWHTRLRGYEVDDVQFARRSFGQSYVLPHPMDFREWRPILSKLVSKAARRLRTAGFSASAVHFYLRFVGHTSWHTSHQLHTPLCRDADLLSSTLALHPPLDRPAKKLAVTFFGLIQDGGQLSYLRDNSRDVVLTHALDSLNDKWGEFTITYGSFLGSAGHVRDAIAFGK